MFIKFLVLIAISFLSLTVSALAYKMTGDIYTTFAALIGSFVGFDLIADHFGVFKNEKDSL